MSLRHLLDRSGVVRAILEVNLRSLIVLRPLGTILLPFGSIHTAVNTRATHRQAIPACMTTRHLPDGRGITVGRPRLPGTSASIRRPLSGLLGTTTNTG